MAALAFTGCGGEDSSEPTASSPASQQETGERGASSGTGPAASKAKGDSDAASSPGTGTASSQGQGKKSAPIQLPEGKRREPTATPAEEAQATVADIALTSPALAAGSPPTLPFPYTCDGKDSWPALQWRGVPQDTEELILFAASVQPVQGKLFFNWAVAGLDPSLEGIEAGQLPKGAIRGQNSFGQNGYSICPPKGPPETYVFVLHAIPEALSPAKGFDPRELRQRILAQAANAGILVFGYSRS